MRAKGVPTSFFLLLSCFVFLSSSRGTEYELQGIIQEERLQSNGREPSLEAKTFSVYVKGCQWLIRTEKNLPGQTPAVREVGSTNGQEIFDLFTPGVATGVPSAAISPTRAHSQAIVTSNEVPASCNESELSVSHLWLMFASSCFFQARTNREITPLYDINACVLHNKDYTQEANWTLLATEPHLPQAVTYINKRGWLTRDTNNHRAFIPLGPPYNQGFINALYTMTGMTNAGRLLLPTGFQYQRFEPGSGKSKDDLRVVAIGLAVVTNCSAACSRANLLPVLPVRNVVVDRRLLHVEPALAALTYTARRDRWVSVEEAKALHAAKLKRAARMKRSPSALAIFLVLMFTPLALILIKSSRARA